MRPAVKIVCLHVWLLLTFSLHAQLALPKVLGNNMVLQQGQPVPIWGTAKAGDEIMVRFNKQLKTTTADSQGNWKLYLDQLTASFTPSQLSITSGTETIILSNILVGEVWLCSGQSNMEYAMRKLAKTKMPVGVTDWPINEVEQAHNKALRIFLVDRKKMKPDPNHQGWSTAEDSALRAFSAVGYFFAKKLHEQLKVPIGIISSAIPGSRIEPWMPKEAMTALPYFQQPTDASHKVDGDPGKFYSTMIEPLAPFAIKGFLWYQGESNCFLHERLQYAYKMKALINQWRNVWNSNNMPFYYVQIAPYAYSTVKDSSKSYTQQSLLEFWEVQSLALNIPNTGMVATVDLNPDLPDLHPVNKWDVGKRLALCALSKTYHIKNVTAMGPLYSNMKIAGNQIELGFDYTGNGLTSKDGQPLQGFEIAGADGKYVTATAIIQNNKVYVSAKAVQHPVSARYNWSEAAQASLYNKNGLPALPFRTDNPLIKQFK